MSTEGQAPPETEGQRLHRLMRFYSAETVDELVSAMEHHIEKLQSERPRPGLGASRPGERGTPNRLREG